MSNKPQSQEALNDHLLKLVGIANKEGLYDDAADLVKSILERKT